MGNERLRKAMFKAGLTYRDLAEKLDIDPKTPERWVTEDRIPYPRHRVRLCEMLGVPELELWPELAERMPPEDGLNGDWWAAWQSSKGGIELVAVQPVQIVQKATAIEWKALERGRPVAEGGYLWRGELRLWDREILMGHYAAVEPAVRSMGTVFLRLHPQGRLMVGRWTGLAFDGFLFSGWGVLARDETECRETIGDLIEQGDRPWMRSLT